MKYYPSYQSYRTAWDHAYHEDPPIPLNIDLELSGTCNLSCPFCYISDPKYKKPIPHFMLPDTIRNTIVQAHELGVPAVKLNWIGEPTLHPSFNWILDYINTKEFYDIIINTNGNYDNNDKLKGLLLTNKIILSIDSFNQAIYNKLRCRGNLNLVINNIKHLITNNHPNIIIRRVITIINKLDNYKKDFYNLFQESKNLRLMEHYVFNRNHSKNRYIFISKNYNYTRKYCGYPSQRLVIATNGDVFPCCMDAKRTMKLGNINKDKMIDIWNSRNIQWIRKLLRSNKMPSRTCKHCESWMAYQHPYAKYVQDEQEAA